MRLRIGFALLGVTLYVAGCTPSPSDDLPSLSQALMGGAGDVTVNATNTVVNRYAALAADANASATSFTVVGPAFGGAAPTPGDLLLIIQMQGATIGTTDDINFGNVTALNNAGRYEFVTFQSMTAAVNPTVNVATSCGGLRNSYSAAGHTQVVWVPQYRTLTITNNGQITSSTWNGSTGGVVAVQAESLVVGGAATGAINVDGRGFRGGARDTSTSFNSTIFRAGDATLGAEKGEGIAGSAADYDALGGRYGRGAAANGGGGGNAHNAGGGGGANASSGGTWTGQGVMDAGATGAGAWALDPGYIANGNARTNSPGGGRGGYSFSSQDRDALTEGPGNTNWAGDNRMEHGGLGGRPLSPDANSRIFFGGGGGAGDLNNNDTLGADGAAGGGLVYIMTGSVSRYASGSFLISANGADAANARPNGTNGGRDAPGGGGGGGTIILRASSAASTVALRANGGKGGDQNIVGYGSEAEGPGGGGGGGFIAASTGAATTSVVGGANGTSNGGGVTEFPTNGATRGNAGATATVAYDNSLPACLATDLQITISPAAGSATIGGPLTYTVVVTNAGPNRVIGATVGGTFSASLGTLNWTCTGTACPAASGTGFSGLVLGALDPAATATFSIATTVSQAATGNVVSTVNVAAPSFVTDPTSGNNSATSTLATARSNDLAINISHTPVNPVTGGAATTFTVPVSNAGPSDSASVTATVTLPAGFTAPAGVNANGWTCSTAAQVVTCTRAAGIASGGSSTFTVTANAPSTANTYTVVAAVGTTADPATGNNTQNDSVVVTVPPVNQPPVQSIPPGATINEDTPLFFSSTVLRMSVGDPDAGTAPLTTTLSVASGALTLGSTTGLTVTGNGTNTLSITGPQASIAAALGTLSYTPAANFNGLITITVTTNDNGNTGTGGAKSDTDQCVVTVVAVNDPPVNTIASSNTINEDAILTFSPTVSDVDVGLGAISTTLSVGNGNGTITLGSTAGVTVAGNGTGSVTVSGLLAEVNAALANTTYTPPPNRTTGLALNMLTVDNGNTGSGGMQSDSDVMFISFTAVNDPPVNTVPASASVAEDGTLVFSAGNGNAVSVNDVDIASSPLAVTISVGSGTLTLGSTAALTVTGNGTGTVQFFGSQGSVNAALSGLSYKPAANSTTGTTFTITSNDGGATGSGGAKSDTDSFQITVNAVNDPPVNTLPLTASMQEDGTLVFSTGNGNAISATDIDLGSGNLTVTLTASGGGTLTLGSTGGVTVTGNGSSSVSLTGTEAAIAAALQSTSYKPAANANGTATITMVTSDNGNTGSGGAQIDTDVCTVTIAAVNDNPTANNDTANVTTNSVTGVTVNVLGNDSSAPDTGETLTVTSVTQPMHGTVDIVGNQVRYIPAPGYSGPDSFTYTISDGNGGTATATVAVTVGATNPNQPPVVTVPPAQTVAEDEMLTLGGGPKITVSDPDSGVADVELRIAVDHGTLTLPTTAGLTFLDGDGTNDPIVVVRGRVTALATALDGAIFTPSPNYFGAAKLTITVDDLGNTGTGGPKQTTATLAITVTPVNDNPTAVDDTVSVKSGTPSPIDVLANDSSAPDGPETLSITSVGTPSHGTALVVDGKVSYTPDDAYLGDDTVTYTISDGNGGTATATIHITVVPADQNLPPVNTLPASAQTNEDTPLTLMLGVADPDSGTSDIEVALSVDSGSLSFVVTGGLTFVTGDGTADTTVRVRGTAAAINNALGAIIFTPTSNANGTVHLFMTSDDLGHSGTGGAKTDSDQLSIVVVPVNDNPTANNDTAATEAGGAPVHIDVLANDTAAPDSGEVLSIVSVTTPASGSVAINGSEVVFTPDPTFVGTVTFDYTINDGHGGTATATVTIDVTTAGVNNPPVNRAPMTASVPEDGTLTFGVNSSNNLTVSDEDAGSAPLTVTITVEHGTFAVGSAAGVTVTGSGTTMVTLVGPQSAINQILDGATYTPDANYNGPATITIVTDDGGATGTGGPKSDTDTIAVTVTPVNDPPVAVDDSVSALGKSPSTFDVLANDSTGPDTGETLTIVDVTQPMHGTVAIVDGKIVYTPTGDYTGMDTFTYTISDGHGGTATATVTVAVDTTIIDTDGDGIPDDVEKMTGTDPKDDDTDDDGIPDGVEDKNHNGKVDPGETDPRNADTDGDGLQDGTESGLTMPGGKNTDPKKFIPDADPTTKTDPLDPDTDHGSVKDGDEDTNHNGKRDPGERDPLDPKDDVTGDSDGDGIPDVIEAGSCTSATDADSDNDGLKDGEEDKNHNGQVDPGETNPCDPDSDHGGVSDGIEVSQGDDPLNPKDDRHDAIAGGGVVGCNANGSGTDGAAMVVAALALVVLGRRRRA